MGVVTHRRRFEHRWPERVLREQVQDIGQEQLLVLLFVMQAERDEIVRRFGEARHRARHRGIDMVAPGEDVGERGARQQAARGAVVAIALCLVITVEQIGIAIVVEAIAGDVIAQQEGFEKPRRVREMPFGGRGIGHRLGGGVGIGQRRGERAGEIAHAKIGGGERDRVGRRGAGAGSGGGIMSGLGGHEIPYRYALPTKAYAICFARVRGWGNFVNSDNMVAHHDGFSEIREWLPHPRTSRNQKIGSNLNGKCRF